jgi:hypothetical protein
LKQEVGNGMAHVQIIRHLPAKGQKVRYMFVLYLLIDQAKPQINLSWGMDHIDHYKNETYKHKLH